MPSKMKLFISATNFDEEGEDREDLDHVSSHRCTEDARGILHSPIVDSR